MSSFTVDVSLGIYHTFLARNFFLKIYKKSTVF